MPRFPFLVTRVSQRPRSGPILRRLARGLVLLVGGLVADPAAAQKQIARVEIAPGVFHIVLTSVFEPPPPSGYLALIAEVSNATSSKHTLRVNASSSENYNGDAAIRSSFVVTAEPGSAQSTLLVPLSPSGANRYRSSQHHLSLTVSSDVGGPHTTTDYSERVQEFPAIALSDALARTNLTQLNDELVKSAGGRYSADKVFGSRFKAEQLPDSWLGVAGFDDLMITGDEWLAAAPGARAAVLQAVEFGLHLHLYRPNTSVTLASLGFADADEGAEAVARGLGRIELHTWYGSTLNPVELVARFSKKKSETRFNLLTEDYARGYWGLKDALGERDFAGGQVVAFLLAFGILIGPINLFLLAPAGRRHRLFFTTPLISLGASLALVGLILLQDGTGGSGRRFIAVHLPPGQASAHVTQEQISRTGVVLGSSFSLPRPGVLNPIVLSEDRWTKYHDGHSSQPIEGRIDGTQVSGNWFQSRTVQAQWLQSIVPTRGRIDIVPPKSEGEAPSLISSLEMELTNFTYRDASGALWRAPTSVSQGRAVTLVKAEGADWKKELAGLCSRAHARTSDRIQESLATRSAFFASAQSASGLAIDTLEAIRWSDDQIVVFGNLPTAP